MLLYGGSMDGHASSMFLLFYIEGYNGRYVKLWCFIPHARKVPKHGSTKWHPTGASGAIYLGTLTTRTPDVGPSKRLALG